jgi:preprotein translocase subunit YajC
MFRRQKKAQKTLLEQQSKIGPGVEVMTQFGLFGTVVSVDNDENKVVLEISPGSQATVHLQTVTKVITADALPAEDDAEDVSGTGGATAVTRDAETLTGGAVDPTVETPEETLARLNKDKKNNES